MRGFLRPLFWFVGAFVLATKAVEWTTEAWFYEDLGVLPVFRRLMLMRGALFVGGATVAAALLWLNLRHAKIVAARHSISPAQRLIPLQDKRLIDRYRPLGAGVTLAFLVTLSGSYAAVHDFAVWRALTFENTATRDPVFGRDLAFYLFQLPALNFLWTFVFLLLWMNLLLVALVYAYEDVWQTRGRLSSISAPGLRHLAVLGAFLLLWKALGYRLSAWNMITARGEPLGGFDWTALHFRLPILMVLAVFAFVAALALWRASRLAQDETRAARRVLLIWAGATVVVGSLVPVLVETFYVKPRRALLEKPLLEQRRAATREAFFIHNVRDSQFANAKNSEADLPLWSPEWLQSYFNKNQRRGENFVVGAPHLARYRINGAARAVFVAAREGIGSHSGNGLIFCDATQISPDGQPLLYDAARFPELRARHAEIIFGNAQNARSLQISTRGTGSIPDFWQRQNLSVPAAYTLFSAENYGYGLDLKSFWRRFLLSWRFFDGRLWDAPHQKIVWHRQITLRCQRLAPFFVYGEARAVLSQGRIKWLVPAHSVADSYPLAFAVQNSKINYLRTGAVAVVDAYDGQVQFFALDDSDWLLQAHRRIFPEIFQDFTDLPPDLRAHLAPSPLQFAAQSDLWGRVFAPNLDEILQKKTLTQTSIRQVLPWNDGQTLPHLATPFWGAKNITWIQIFSQETKITDEKVLSTPITGALLGEMKSGKPQLYFWRPEKAFPLPQMPEKSLFSFYSALENGELLLRGVRFANRSSTPTAFWFSEKAGFQSDFSALLASRWNKNEAKTGTQVAKSR